MDRNLTLLLGGAAALWLLTRARQERSPEEGIAFLCDGDWTLVDYGKGPVWQCQDSRTGRIITAEYLEPPAEAVDAARAALMAFTEKQAVVMTAIAGAESSWNPDAAGDRRWGQWSCNGYQSWGLWQIRIPLWKDVLATMGAPRTPCGMAEWLRNPYNNARAARAILDRQGFDAWSSYVHGTWRRFVPHALGAVVQALSNRVVA